MDNLIETDEAIIYITNNLNTAIISVRFYLRSTPNAIYDKSKIKKL